MCKEANAGVYQNVPPEAEKRYDGSGIFYTAPVKNLKLTKVKTYTSAKEGPVQQFDCMGHLF